MICSIMNMKNYLILSVFTSCTYSFKKSNSESSYCLYTFRFRSYYWKIPLVLFRKYFLCISSHQFALEILLKLYWMFNWASIRLLISSFASVLNQNCRSPYPIFLLFLVISQTIPKHSLTTRAITKMFRTNKGRGLLRDLNSFLNILTWLVMEMKVALLEAELNV